MRNGLDRFGEAPGDGLVRPALLLAQAMRGAPASAALAPLGALLAFVVLLPPPALWRMRRLMSDPAYWGRT